MLVFFGECPAFVYQGNMIRVIQWLITFSSLTNYFLFPSIFLPAYYVNFGFLSEYWLSRNGQK